MSEFPKLGRLRIAIFAGGALLAGMQVLLIRRALALAGGDEVVFALTLSIWLICVSLGHMYMGSVGMEGAFEAMRSGYVDINWADEHHDRWGKECHDKDLIVSADEFEKATGRKPVIGENLATSEGK